MLDISSLSVAVGDKQILHDIDLSVPPGEVHVLLGPNGSGKSSVLAAIMGLAPYEVTQGTIHYRGQPISDLATDARAGLGLGMAFQRPPELDGVSVHAFATALNAAQRLNNEASSLDMNGLLDRDLMVGFSGGEIKRWEVLKLFLQDPDFFLFDEPESGVDLEHIAAIGRAINRLVSRPAKDGTKRGALLITHTGLILDHLKADKGHLMLDGRIIHSGVPAELFKHIQREGYVAPAA